MSSLKMTFSLASLILIFAFAAIPVMANDGHIADNPPHVHHDAPTVVSVELVNVMADSDGDGTVDVDTVSGTSVVLVDDVAPTAPAVPNIADGASAAGFFLVKITFSEDVYDGAAATLPDTTAVAAADDLEIGELSPAASEVSNAIVNLVGARADSAISISAVQHQVFNLNTNVNIPTLGAIDAASKEDLKVFWVTVEVGHDLFGGETDETVDLPINYWLGVNENAVYTRTTLVGPVTTYGAGNEAYEPTTADNFTIVSTLTPTAANTPPVFDENPPSGAMLTWCEGEMKDELAIRLPKARDSESTSTGLTYSLMGPAGRIPEDNSANPPMVGLYWVTRDSENRYIRGTAELADAGEYTWEVMDDGTPPMSNEDPMTFTITVDAAEKPGAPTSVMAMKLDSAAMDMADPDYNRVSLTWVDGNPTSFPNADCIPKVIAYIVTRTPVVNGELDATMAMTERITKADDADETHYDLSDPMNVMYMTEDALAVGTYVFTIEAVSSHPISDADMVSDDSDAATWDKTGGTWVIVANPPAAPTDLRATVNEVTDEVTVNWIAPTENSMAPVDDTDPADQMRVYGVAGSFGGYAVYQIKDGDTVRYPMDEDEFLMGDEVVFETEALTSGEYSFRVTAANIAGESRRSVSTPYSTVTVVAVDQPPVFTKTSIDTINAMQDVELPEAISLPTASDPEGNTVYYGVEPDLPDGLEFNDDASPAPTITGAPETAGTTEHTYTAYDYDPSDATASGQSASISFRVIVEAAPGVVTPEDPAATYDAATATTTIQIGTVSANGFYVIEADALPNLELFFSTGGTITLMDPADAAAKTVVMSEILWGLDFGEPALTQDSRQFIELYNTNMTGSIDLAGWKLVFKEGRPTPANDVDQVSNVDGTGWIVDVGQSGRVTGTTLMGGTVLPTDIISMYRNINYAKVQNTDGGDVAKRLDGVPGGNAKGSWEASTRVTTDAGVKSSPMRRHFKPVEVLEATKVPRTPFVINEIGNGSGGAGDWVEFRNVTEDEQSLKNYQLSVVTGDADTKKDEQLFHFHDKDYKVPGKGVIVVYSTHPRNNQFAQGKDVSVADDQEENRGGSHLFVVRSFDLPDTGKTLLILRKSAKSHEKQHLGTPKDIIDVIGALGIAIKTADFETKLWPLSLASAPHGNVIDGQGSDEFSAGKVYTRGDAGGGTGEKDIGIAGYTGLGYDRAATANAQNGGTPGYDNGAIKGKVADLSDAEVSFSEIMLDVGTGRLNLPQWIEIYNGSMTQAVNLSGWKLTIENAKDVDTALDAILTLGDMKIQPNQTVLIVTNSGRVSDPDHFPSKRVLNLWTTKAHRDALGTGRRADQVFSATGLYLKLTDADNKLVDEFGNLDGSRRTRDEPKWDIPMADDDERRSSLIRIYESGVALDGKMSSSWVSADTTNLAFAISETYYGDPDDYGTPGFRAGGPLPVSLSKFRPERLKDTGEVVVRWATESELNNAGFNILRSEKRDGEFTKVHFEAGQGTTSERSVYEWKDTTAKPNVVYYYQIQDVSLDGDVTPLRITHLRGNVTVAGKLTTIWGEIKALQ